jgi:hypothetical protein
MASLLAAMSLLIALITSASNAMAFAPSQATSSEITTTV